jgi:proteic killer suppression protein
MFEVEFADKELDQLEVDPRFTGGFAPAIVRGFRKAMQAIRAAHDERDLYASRGLGFEKLKGKRAHQCSVRLNKQWRLILELKDGDGAKKIRIIGIEDYH